MKLKSTPNDFRVAELTDLVPTAGPFSLYRLDKTNLTTHDALLAIRQRWHVAIQRISFGGLKDRHASTAQFLTIHHGPPRDLTDQSMTLTFIGHVASPFTSNNIRGNGFKIVIRDLTAADAQLVATEIDALRTQAIPNYFDDQRFGSLTGGEFIARLMILGNYEEAIKLALTSPYEFDKSDAKKEKTAIRDFWGRWDECLNSKSLGRGMARDIIEFLSRQPGNFRGAVTHLWPESQGLFLAAYQSYIWNRMLAELNRQRFPADRCIELQLKIGPVPVPRDASSNELAELSSLMLPLPSARLRYDPQAIWAPLIDAALRDQGFTLNQMKLPGLRQPFFSKGDRAALVQPRELSGIVESDERNPDQFKVTVSFELPRGSYATILIKRLLAQGLAAKIGPLD